MATGSCSSVLSTERGPTIHAGPVPVLIADQAPQMGGLAFEWFHAIHLGRDEEGGKVAFIEYIPEEGATPDVAAAYRRYRASWGGVDHILRIHGPNPASMDAHVGLYRVLMHGDSPLTRAQREMLATVVSTVNRCHY